MAVLSTVSKTERRVHRVFVTRNTEYHVRRDVCVAVKDRRSGEWLRAHLALRQTLQGGIKFTKHGGIAANLQGASVGESLFFSAEGRDLVTSPILAVERPEKQIVTSYPS